MKILFIFLFQYIFSYYISPGLHNDSIITNFSYGSCYRGPHGWRSDIFNTVMKSNPQLWLWLGDAAYVDKLTIFHYYRSTQDLNFTKVEEIFNDTKNNQFYSILNKATPTIGVWDDHDFAMNDGNGYFSHKELAKKYYLDFLDEPINSTRRDKGRSIYTTYAFGNGYKTVRFILLDVRFHKQSYIWDDNPDILDEEQWRWLENILKDNNETFTFICSGTQILPFNRLLSEAWYTKSRKRLFDLIGKYKKSGVILLTGDIHMAQFLKTFCVLPEIGYDIHEITTSGLSHYFKFSYLLDYVLPNDYKDSQTISNYNFADINIDWGQIKNDSKINIKIKGIDGNIQLEKSLYINDLIYDEKKIIDNECYNKINSRFKSLRDYAKYYIVNKSQIFYLLMMYFIYTIFICVIIILMYIPFAIIKKLYQYVTSRKKHIKTE